MKRFGQVAVVAVALAATARAAAAQLPGIPYGPVETGTGISLAADYGKPEGRSAAYGLSAGIGFASFGLSASVGAEKPKSSSFSTQTSIGGRLGMKLFGGGLNPLTVGLQVGASTVKRDSAVAGPPPSTVTNRATMIMPGAWVRVSPPLFPLKPWGQVYYVAGTNVKKEARFTVGANFNLLLGLGVHGAYDWGDSGSTWGVGAHFTFRVPGLGVPGVPGM